MSPMGEGRALPSRCFWGFAIALLLLPAAASAESPYRLGPLQEVVASSGVFEILKDADTYEIGAEFRFAPRRFPWLPRFVPALIPTAGTMASSRGILYAYGGFRIELPLAERWEIGAGSAAGLYEPAHGKNLNGPLEFRSHVELSFRLSSGSRVGLCLYHLSNAGLHTGNPGSESLVFSYSAPLQRR
jgi:Lipid A 3-O-deacylase (PagL)